MSEALKEQALQWWKEHYSEFVGVFVDVPGALAKFAQVQRGLAFEEAEKAVLNTKVTYAPLNDAAEEIRKLHTYEFYS